MSKPKSSHLRRQKAKAAKARASETTAPSPAETNDSTAAATETSAKSEIPKREVADAAPDYDFDDASVTPGKSDDVLLELYKDVMGRFSENAGDIAALQQDDKPEVLWNDDDEIGEEDDDEDGAQPKLSKKKRKELSKLSVAELKALVNKPEIVEWTDTSSSDPRLLVHIKSYRNVVPVPTHWSLKREYLSSKRGVEKPPFALPKFIQETGIAEMRDAVLEKQADQSLKQKQRERVQGKTGRLDIDYQKLYEAFFRFQTKPELTRYGEVYYEGKEYETNLKHLRPGELSDELNEALNMPPGAPPPWLINQQRFGPPPSYPALKIPGLNAPPPPGAQWGYHPGGYGKPPLDEYNRPLYGGDIFGVMQTQQTHPAGEPVEKALWGELQEPEEESEEDSDEDEEESDDDDVDDASEVPGGTETPSGMASMAPSEYTGTESVTEEMNLRKQRRGPDSGEPSGRSAFTHLQEQQARMAGFVGSDRRYDLSGASRPDMPVLGQEDSRKRKKPGDVDVSLDPDSLQASDGIAKSDVQRQYESQRQQEQGQWGFQEDLSDLIASESRKRQKRDEERKAGR